jgi:hypothetical protein
MKHIVKKGLGVVLIVLGFLALITPFSPGSWLILVGLELLGLRILLEGRLRACAAARPDSLLAKVIHKILRIRDQDSAPTRRRARDEKLS